MSKRPSHAQFAAIRLLDSECRRLGVDCCKRPESIKDSTFWSLRRLGLVEAGGFDGDTPLVKLSSHGRSWLPAAKQWPTVRVPAKFYDDHDERDCEPYCNPVKRSSRFVWLRLDDEGLAELLDDARHYAERGQFGDEWGAENGGLVRSAAATVKAIEAAAG
jgi:hypothetical protein